MEFSPSKDEQSFEAGGFTSEDDATEQEAIRVISEQVKEITHLKTQLALKEQDLASAQIQNRQVDAYKNQISNLKHQIQVFEQRFDVIEKEREQFEQRSISQGAAYEHHSLETQKLIQQYKGTIAITETQLIEETKRRKQAEEQISQQTSMLDQKEKVCTVIRSQVEQLSEELQTLQSGVHTKESALLEKVRRLKKDKKELVSEKKSLETRCKDMQNACQQRAEDAVNLQRQINERDQTIRKQKADHEKLRKSKVELEARLPFMENQMKDLQELVDRCSMQLEKETKKKVEAIQTKDKISEQLVKYIKIYDELQIDDPEKFKEEFDALKQDIIKYKKQLTDKTKVVTMKETKLKSKEEELKKQEKRIGQALKMITNQVTEEVAFSKLCDANFTVKNQQLELQESNPMEALIIRLYSQLQAQVQMVANKCLTMSQRQETLSQELKEGQQMKVQIVSDFRKLQEAVDASGNESKDLQEEIAVLQLKLKETQAELSRQSEGRFEDGQQMQKFLIECYNTLLNIRHKYENSNLISQQTDLKIKNNFQEYGLEEAKLTHQSICVLELANMIGNITSVLNFEVKNVGLKEEKITELQEQVDRVKAKSQELLMQQEQQFRQKIQEVEISSEKKVTQFREFAQELEGLNREAVQKLETISPQLKHCKEENQALKSTLSEMQDELEGHRENLPHLIFKLNDLIDQKRILTRMMNSAAIKIENQKAVIKKIVQSFNIAGTEAVDLGEFKYEKSCLRFRKAVISVIALNRIFKKAARKLSYSEIQRSLSLFKVTPNADVLKALTETSHRISETTVLDIVQQGCKNLKFGLGKSSLIGTLQEVFQPHEQSQYHLQLVEHFIQSQRHLLQETEAKNQDLEIQLSEADQKRLELQQQHKNVLIKFTEYQKEHEGLQQEVKNSVPMEEYQRLKQAWDSMSSDVAEMTNAVEKATMKVARAEQINQELTQEKQQLFQKCLLAEQQFSDKSRDCELKDIKIESLENIMKKREASKVKFGKQSLNKEAGEKIEQLQQEKAQMIKKLQAVTEELESVKEKAGKENLQQIQMAREKQAEIQKLLETNLQTLESRCELLEMQNEQLRKEKEELMRSQSEAQLFQSHQRELLLSQARSSIQQESALKLRDSAYQQERRRESSINAVTSPTFQGLELLGRKVDQHNQVAENDQREPAYQEQENNILMINNQSFQLMSAGKMSSAEGSNLEGTLAFGSSMVRPPTSRSSSKGALSRAIPGKISRSSSQQRI